MVRWKSEVNRKFECALAEKVKSVEMPNAQRPSILSTTYDPLVGLDSMCDMETLCSSMVLSADANAPGSSEMVNSREVFLFSTDPASLKCRPWSPAAASWREDS